jgi:phosphoenolpyruvate---glycerone phosphotransferase subunit DhaK
VTGARHGSPAMATGMKFINDPADVVDQMLDGFLRTYPGLVRRLRQARVVVCASSRAAGPRVISGGGSGHEPALLGYVGRGLLDAVVVGDPFASPPADAVLAAIRATDTGQGVLIVIGNYAGDEINFGMAAEWAREEGHEVAMVLVTDDAAAGTDDPRSRRGLAGGVLVWKTAGAAAAAGAALPEVTQVAADAVASTRTVAVATAPAIIPGSDHAAFTPEPGRYQFGVGHGEPGVRSEPMGSADAVVDLMLEPLLTDGFLRAPGTRAVTMVNGLGATPLMELYIVQRHLRAALASRAVTVHRAFVGQFYTAFETAGFSITLMQADRRMARLVSAPARAPQFCDPFGPADV